jgi:Protein of unknown function (DUF2917)
MQHHTWNDPRGNRPVREWIDLDAPQLLRLVDAQGSAVFVSTGTAWITQDGSGDDIVVGAGESFVFDRKGLAIVSPLGRATLSISAPASAHVRIGAAAPGSLHEAFPIAATVGA